jgi:hypothetical protein
MEWIQVLGLILGNAAIVIPLWLHQDNKMNEHAKRMEDETKDFHGRLCQLEEKYMQLMQRIWEK